MAWNLVDEITNASQSILEPLAPTSRRHFFVPLASLPIGQTAVRAIDRTMYTFDETYTALPPPDRRTSDVSLNIHIRIPASGLVDENGYSDPLIRLHAIDSGRIKFQPAGSGFQDRLILEMLSFVFLRTPFFTGVPKWFQRWEDAQSVPIFLIYDNVDRGQLQVLLDRIAVPVSVLDIVEPTNGLQFPSGVGESNKSDYIAQFLAGDADRYIWADSGSVIGTASADPANATSRLLKLHARYQDHTDAVPHPMNPRELFHLLFGNDSAEALTHPFLVRLNEFGQNNQAGVHPESKRMLLRPPLRTWKRVEWEAGQEIDNHHTNWRPAGSLGANRFYNTHSRQANGTGANRLFNNGNYATFNKCNLFIADICIRSGFRTGIHPVGANSWHFIDANSFTNNIHNVAGGDERLAVTGGNDDAGTTWAWKIENQLRAKPAAERQQFLNDAMEQEGRCFILAGARARSFIRHTIIPGVTGIANCANALRSNPFGHIVLVREVSAQPLLAAAAGDGLRSIELETWQASGGGAVRVAFDAVLGGAGAVAAAGTGFIRLHLFELQPGGDPDTVQGLRSLNVQNVPRNLLGTADEAATRTRITHTPAGVPVAPPPAPQNCCEDNYPPQGAVPTITPC